MIPFEEFVAVLERYKLRKQAAQAAGQAAPPKVSSGKPAPAARPRGDQSAIELIEDQ